MPLLIVHGEADAVVPPDHAIALYEAARPPKTLWLVPGAGHIAAFTTAANRAELVHYLTRTLRGTDAVAVAFRRPAIGRARPESGLWHYDSGRAAPASPRAVSLVPRRLWDPRTPPRWRSRR
jgi:fermentation-respiration switch protein FrsA (DUF1100 family)